MGGGLTLYHHPEFQAYSMSPVLSFEGLKTFLKKSADKIEIPQRPKSPSPPKVLPKPTDKLSTSIAYCTMKELCQIRGCKTDMDDISLLTFISGEF